MLFFIKSLLYMLLSNYEEIVCKNVECYVHGSAN